MRCPIHKDIIILEDVNDMGYFCFECQKYYSEKDLLRENLRSKML